MVKFIVTVKDVENNVKSHLGRVMEVNVITESSKPGTILKMIATT